MPGIGGQCGAPQTILRAGFQPHLRAQPIPRGINRPGKRHLAASDDGDLIAQALGMRDHVGGENHCGAALCEAADHAFAACPGRARRGPENGSSNTTRSGL